MPAQSPPSIGQRPRRRPISFILGLATSASGLTDWLSGPYEQRTDRSVIQFIQANQRSLTRDLSDGILDAALVHHLEADSQYWFSPVALDGLAIVANPRNGIFGLSLAQIAAIFAGRVKNWAEIGGADLPITLFSREEGSSTEAIFRDRVLAA